MTDIDVNTDALISSWLTIPEIAETHDLEVRLVEQWIREGRLIAVRRGGDRELQVPAEFITEGGVIKGLGGVLTILRNSSLSDVEMLEWMFTEDPALSSTPAKALRENRGNAVQRLASERAA
ncbi:Rv2175c family DNA-binding protein [Streptomyces sp. C3-3]|uniref:Rv2175c family DNA-binding protein n=1 Tax=Streptomyces sp. C3-3 TaxID=2824901 RepID=UPI001B392CD5|nr:Rv2175c family DNA-binding protein [Streptomyces sp. C3-3]MBQ1116232.1 DNA-binding protein [Streptomyces sp. C3-3]